MPGTVNRDVQSLPIVTPATQAAGEVSGSGTNIDGANQVPFVLLLDENVPSRKVSPAGDDTLQALLATDTAALSNFTAAMTAAAILPANSARVGVIIHNDSASSTLYIAYATAAGDASLAHFSVKLSPGALWEMPHPIYRNVLSGIWDGTDGAARVTELTL